MVGEQRGSGGGDDGQRTGGGCGPSRSGNTKTSGSKFTRNTLDMLGHVLQIASENSDRHQLSNTLDMAREVLLRKFPNSDEIMMLFDNPMQQPSLTAPVKPTRTPPDPSATADGRAIARKDFNYLRKGYNALEAEYKEKLANLEKAKKILWGLLWGQCSDRMPTKLRTYAVFIDRKRTSDVFWILAEAKKFMHQIDQARHTPTSLDHARKSFYNCKQGSLTNEEYLKSFTVARDVLLSYQCEIGDHFSQAPTTNPDTGALYTQEERQTIFWGVELPSPCRLGVTVCFGSPEKKTRARSSGEDRSASAGEGSAISAGGGSASAIT